MPLSRVQVVADSPAGVWDPEMLEELDDRLAPPCLLAQPQASADLGQVDPDLDPDVALAEPRRGFRVAACVVGRGDEEVAGEAGAYVHSREKSRELEIGRVDLVGVSGLNLGAPERERLDQR